MLTSGVALSGRLMLYTPLTSLNQFLNGRIHSWPVECGSYQIKCPFDTHVAHVIMETVQGYCSQLLWEH